MRQSKQLSESEKIRIHLDAVMTSKPKVAMNIVKDWINEMEHLLAEWRQAEKRERRTAKKI